MSQTCLSSAHPPSLVIQAEYQPARSSPRANGKAIRAARVIMGTVAMDLMGPVGPLVKEELGKSVPPQAASTAGCSPSPMADGFMRGCCQTLGSGGEHVVVSVCSPLVEKQPCPHGKLGLKIIDSEGGNALLMSPRKSTCWKELKTEKFP